MEANYDIKNLTSFKIGGNISRMYFPRTIEEFISVREKEPEASNYFQFENVLDEFKALSDDAKAEVKLDMNKVQHSYEISASKYAKQIEDTILLKCSQYEDTPEYFKHLSTEIESCTKDHPAYVKELVFSHILDRVKKH